MRIGVKVTSAEVSAVAVHVDGPNAHARRAGGGDLGAAVADVIAQLRGPGAETVDAVVFDVSAALVPDAAASVISVLIEPREPLEPLPHLWTGEDIPVDVTHVRGGHNALGDELVSLDEEKLRRLAEEVPAGAHLVVSAAGSPVNRDHERRAAEIIKTHPALASITESSSFHADSLLVREFTAVLNALLLASAEQLAHTLQDVVGRAAGAEVRALVATNEGGCTPLTRLPITPVHSIRADIAAEILGAATLAGRTDGRIIVADAGGVRIGDVVAGLPSVISRTTLRGGVSLASSFARVVPLTDLLLTGSPEPPTTVLVRGGQDQLAVFGLASAVTTADDLVALGAAVAPLSYWHNRTVRIASAAELERALKDAQTAARANLVAWGADPAAVRITESRALATTYGEPQTVRVRVRGVAAAPPSALPAQRLIERSIA